MSEHLEKMSEEEKLRVWEKGIGLEIEYLKDEIRRLRILIGKILLKVQ
jgi:hypothetical protein